MFKLKLIKKPILFKLKCNFSFPPIVLANLQEKEVTPTKEKQEVVADKNYDGLSKVTVDKIPDEYIIPTGNIEITKNGVYNVREKETANVNIPMLKLGTKNITENGVYKASDDELDGYSEVNVETSGVDINDYFDKNIGRGINYSYFKDSGVAKTLLKWRTPLTVNDNIGDYMFSNFPFDMPDLEQSSKLTSANYMFYNYRGTVIKEIDTSNITSFNSFLYNCHNIKELPLLNFKSAKSIGSWAFYTTDLEKTAGLKDVGMAYENTKAENYSAYSVDFHFCTKLLEQSLINILNNLYDIKTKGCKPQKVVLGNANLAKLTSEEGQQALSNAQVKGWTVS